MKGMIKEQLRAAQKTIKLQDEIINDLWFNLFILIERPASKTANFVRARGELTKQCNPEQYEAFLKAFQLEEESLDKTEL